MDYQPSICADLGISEKQATQMSKGSFIELLLSDRILESHTAKSILAEEYDVTTVPNNRIGRINFHPDVSQQKLKLPNEGIGSRIRIHCYRQPGKNYAYTDQGKRIPLKSQGEIDIEKLDHEIALGQW